MLIWCVQLVVLWGELPRDTWSERERWTFWVTEIKLIASTQPCISSTLEYYAAVRTYTYLILATKMFVLCASDQLKVDCTLQ